MKKTSADYLIKEEFNVRLGNISAIVNDRIECNNIMTQDDIKKY